MSHGRILADRQPCESAQSWTNGRGCWWWEGKSHSSRLCLHSGITRTMKASSIGTVKAVWPWAGLQIMPFLIKPLRNGPAVCTLIPRTSAISPDRCGPGPSEAMARR